LDVLTNRRILSEHLDFAEAYLVGQGEATGVGAVASCDRWIDRVA